MRLVRALCMNGSFAAFEIEGGNSDESVGDQVWFSSDGCMLEIHECVDVDILIETSKLFDKPKALLGAFHRMVEE